MYEGRLLRPAPAREPEPTQAAGLEELVKESIEEIEAKDPVIEFGENAIEEYKNQYGETVNDDVDVATEKQYDAFDDQEDEAEEIETPEPIPTDKAEPFINEFIPNEETEEAIRDIQNGVNVEQFDINELAEIRDNPDTPLIETSWTKPSPAYQNGKLILKSRSDGKQHVFEGATEEEAKAKAYAALKLFYDVSNLSL